MSKSCFRPNIIDSKSSIWWKHHLLPDLVPVYVGDQPKTVVLNRMRNEVSRERTLYRLAWPGQISDEVGDQRARAMALSSQYQTGRLFDAEAIPKDLKIKEGLASIEDLLNVLPEQIPEDLGYWLAVNAQWLPSGAVRPVAGLPAKYAEQVVSSTFLLDDAAIAATAYLRWLAQSHWGHPLLSNFDTLVRDELVEIAIVATRCYFYLVSDYLYSEELQWYDHERKPWWPQKAAYLFWVCRTGGGCYAHNSGFAAWDSRKPDPEFIAQSLAWKASLPKPGSDKDMATWMGAKGKASARSKSHKLR